MKLVSFLAALFGASPAQPQTGKGAAGNDSAFICNGMDAREVLRRLRAQKADLSQQREAVFYFYGAEKNLPQFQAELERMGFAVRPTQTQPGRVATMMAAVSEDWLRQMVPRLCSLAAENDIEYDGWEAIV